LSGCRPPSRTASGAGWSAAYRSTPSPPSPSLPASSQSRVCISQIFLCQCCGSGIRCLFVTWIRDPGWVKNQDPGSGSGTHKPNHISLSGPKQHLKFQIRRCQPARRVGCVVHNFLLRHTGTLCSFKPVASVADPGSGVFYTWIRDP
jgi:hypothetical protein